MTWRNSAQATVFATVLAIAGCISVEGPRPPTETPPQPSAGVTLLPTPAEPTPTAVAAEQPTPTAEPPPLATPTPEATVVSPSDGHVIFRSDRDERHTFELFVMRPDGSDLEKVADADLLALLGIAQPDDPVLSPVAPADGARPTIAYVGLTDPSDDFGDIFVMGCCEASSRNLTDDPSHDAHPGWSPDGSRIAFESDRDGDYEIYLMDRDGSNIQQLTDDPAADANAVWHPDGQRLAFTSTRDGSFDVFVVNADGSGLVQLTNGQAHDSFPAWSTDGSMIAFASDRDGAARDIYVIDADGSNITRLTTAPEADSDPWWSPDGTRIAFETKRLHGTDGPLSIFVMNADGGNVVPLAAELDASAEDPSWSPW